MIIFLDFDDVIFNTKDFKDDLLSVFVKNGITEEQFHKTYWGRTYDLERQIKDIVSRYKIDESNLKKDVSAFLENLREYIFSDVYQFLEGFKKENLYILSYGHLEVQQQKIKNSEIEKYFKKIFITDKTKSEVMKNIIKEEGGKNETIYFVDDRISYIEDVKKNFPEIKTILMKRPEGRYQDECNEFCDYESKSLMDAISIIKSLNHKSINSNNN